METKTPEQEDIFKNRYDEIDEANRESFYMTDPDRSLDVFMSVHNTGGYRMEFDPVTSADRIIRAEHELAGNVSDVGSYGPASATPEERMGNARSNMARFFETIGVPQESVYILNPERDYSTPITIVNADEQEITENTTWPVRLDNSGDFVYTRDPNKVLAGRPADCPIMFASADTPEGKVYMLVHYAWRGAGCQYVAQTADAFDTLGVDRSSLEIYLSPGAHAENYPYDNYPRDPREEFPDTDGLFTGVESFVNDAGETRWRFNIDTPKFVYDQVLEKFGVDPKQVFCDTSDTGALESGYSSHGRSMRLKDQGESNTRDIVCAVYH